MNEIETDRYPVRYVAFENPGTIVKSAEVNGRGGKEFMVYYEPRRNKVYPSFTDGIYGEISSYQGKDYLVDVHVTVPDGRREQQSWSKCFKNLDIAYEYFVAAINEAKKYLAQEVKKDENENVDKN